MKSAQEERHHGDGADLLMGIVVAIVWFACCTLFVVLETGRKWLCKLLKRPYVPQDLFPDDDDY